MRFRPALVLLSVSVLLTGCTSEPAPIPTAAATATSPSPTPTQTQVPTPEPPESGAEFMASQLADLCTEKTRSLAPNATYHSDIATSEWLDATSVWFVVIPKTLGNQDSVAVCAIGGTPEVPVFELAGETLPSGVAEIRDELLAGVHDGEL